MTIAASNKQFLAFTGNLRRPSAVIFDNPGDMLEAMFGPSQHDAHVVRWRKHLWRVERDKWNDAADARVREALVEINNEYRARRKCSC